MSVNVHIAHIKDDWTDVLANLDDLQWAEVNTGVNASAAETNVPQMVYRDGTDYYFNAVAKHWTGAAWNYHDVIFNDVYAQSDVFVADNIIHTGDTDTYLAFHSDTDRVQLLAGGVTFFDAVETTQDIFEINPGNTDIDTIINASGVDNALFVQGSSGRVGLLTGSPVAQLDIVNETLTDTGNFFGIRNRWIRTDGADGGDDYYYAISNYLELNDPDGVYAGLRAFDNDIVFAQGTLDTSRSIFAIDSTFKQTGGALNNATTRAHWFLTDLDAGTSAATIRGVEIGIDQEGTHSITGDLTGLYITVDSDGTVSGTVYGVRIVDATGVDYSLHASGNGLFGGTLSAGGGTFRGQKLHVYKSDNALDIVSNREDSLLVVENGGTGDAGIYITANDATHLGWVIGVDVSDAYALIINDCNPGGGVYECAKFVTAGESYPGLNIDYGADDSYGLKIGDSVYMVTDTDNLVVKILQSGQLIKFTDYNDTHLFSVDDAVGIAFEGSYGVYFGGEAASITHDGSDLVIDQTSQDDDIYLRLSNVDSAGYVRLGDAVYVTQGGDIYVGSDPTMSPTMDGCWRLEADNSGDSEFEFYNRASGAYTLKGLINENGRFRSGGSNYRRYYHPSIDSINPGASGATWTNPSANTPGGWQLDAAAETLPFVSDIHSDWDGASDIKVEVTFQVNVNNTGGAVGDTVDLRLQCFYMGTGETVAKTQTVEVATVVGQSAQYKMFKAEFTIDYDATSNVIDTGDNIGFILNLETDTSEVDNIIVNQVSFSYKTSHVGIEDGDE